MSFFAELKRRNVIRVAVAYLVASWLLIEASSLILGIYEAPLWVSQVIVSLLAVGFPVALIFSWVFEMTPDGLKRESEITPDASAAAHTAKKLDVATMVLVVAAVAVLAMDRFVFDRGQEAAPTVADRGQVSAPAGEDEDHSGHQTRAIAVLPFSDMSPQGDQGYFGDGIAEEILNLLAKNPELRVVARTSAFQFRDAADMRAVGEALEADRILEGSVRTAGTRVRITAQLIESETGYHIWSETYDRELTDIFAVQDEIAAAITGALGVHLGLTPSAQAAVGADVDAYRLYLQGREALNERSTPGRLQDAIDLLTRAVGQDPDLAVAHGTLTLAWSLSPWYTRIGQPEAYRRARASADRALAIDPENVEALVGKGYSIAFLGYDPAQGMMLLEEALHLRPNDSMANNLMGDIYRLLGDRDDAIHYESRALVLDPLNSVNHWDLGWAHLEFWEFDAGCPNFARAEELSPSNPFAMSGRVWCELWSGDPEAARALFEELVAIGNYDPANLQVDRMMLSVVLDDEATMAETYRGVMASLHAQDLSLGVQSLVAYMVGDLGEAADLLEQAIAVGDATWFTFGASNRGMFTDLEAAGHTIEISDDFRKIDELSDFWRTEPSETFRTRLVALRDEYRSGR